MPCEFCDRGVPMVAGCSGDGTQYHEWDPVVGGFPMCAFPFRGKFEPHPFIPSLGDGCDFCSLLKDEKVHEVRSKT